MKRLYLFRFIRIFSKKYPIVFFLVLALLGYLLYRYLMTIAWMREILSFVSVMFSVEYGAARMYTEGKSFFLIVGLMLTAHAANILLDLFVVRLLLKSKWALGILNSFSVRGKAFVRDVKRIFLKNWDAKVAENGTNALERIKNHMNGLKANPTKAGLWTVYFLCLAPRIPPLPGGVSIAVLIILYNKMGWRGWLVLACGILSHGTYVLGSIYGVSSLFNLLFS